MAVENEVPLKAFLQVQLAFDSSAASHLPYIIDSLTPECFTPSSHISKWITRIQSLAQSKDPGARWAGFCLARETFLLSRSLFIECAQNWIGIAIPMISNNQPFPVLKAAIRLLRTIFSFGTDMPEFKRQVLTPNVTKFTAALIAQANSHPKNDVKILSLNALSQVIPLHPTAHRASFNALSNLSLSFLNGRTPQQIDEQLLQSASQLYSILHVTGGKVGGASIWRKSMDETLAFGWTAFMSLRNTFPREAHNSRAVSTSLVDDPTIAIPLNADRLRSSVVIFCHLLNTSTNRPVQIPMGELVEFIIALINCSPEDKTVDYVDPMARMMESTAVPIIWKYGCKLLSHLVKCASYCLTPNLARLVGVLTYRLEQHPIPSNRLLFLETLHDLFTHSLPLDSSTLPMRLIKAVIPSVSVVLATSAIKTNGESALYATRKGKKRGRNYQGDEVFKTTREVICQSTVEGSVLVVSVKYQVLDILIQNQYLSPAARSMGSRVLLSLHLALPQIPPALLSPDLTLYSQLCTSVQQATLAFGSGYADAMNGSLPLIIKTMSTSNDIDTIQRKLDIILHPRIPPLVRPVPHIELLALSYYEESQEEKELRESLGLETTEAVGRISSDDIVVDVQSLTTATDGPPIHPSPPSRIKTPTLLPEPTYVRPVEPIPLTHVSSTVDPTPKNIKSPPVRHDAIVASPIHLEDAAFHMRVPSDSDNEEEMPAIDMDSDSDEEG